MTNESHAKSPEAKSNRLFFGLLPKIDKREATTLVLSFFYFMLLLSCYYILRPVRDGLVSGIGTDQVKYLSIAVLLTMLLITPIFGGLMARVPRYKLLPRIYGFTAANLLMFAVLFSFPEYSLWSARIFYVWVTVFNLFVVSVFWSFMADIWTAEQSRRLFGVIAAGGSLGGLLGPTLARNYAGSLGNSGLTVMAAILLCAAMLCLVYLGTIVKRNPKQDAQVAAAFGGSSWQGILLVVRSPFLLGIAALVMIGTLIAMFAYIELGRLAKDAFETPEARTAFFARLDFWTNLVTLILQGLVVGVVTSRFGIKAPLLGLSIIGCISFVCVALSPMLSTLALNGVVRRASEFGLGKPGRDMLYSVTTPQEKYLAKNVIDTVLYRGSDVIGGWLHNGLIAVGVGLAGLSWIAAIAMAGTAFIAMGIARGYTARGGSSPSK